MNEAPRSSRLTEIATWVLQEIERRGGELDERTATMEVVRLFGGEWCELSAGDRFALSPRLVVEIERLAATWPGDLVRRAAARIFGTGGRRGPYR